MGRAVTAVLRRAHPAKLGNTPDALPGSARLSCKHRHKHTGEQPMSYLDMRAALARERQNMLLAEAKAAHAARQARQHRRRTATPARHRSPLRYLVQRAARPA